MKNRTPGCASLRVGGRTDDTGPDDVNKRLSQKRADSVRRYLIDKGVDPRRLNSEGFGEERPMEKGDSAEARKKNRRVEFVVE